MIKKEDIIIHWVTARFIPGFYGEDIVDLSTAKLLKEHGFKGPTHHYWQGKSLSFSKEGLKRVKLGKRRMNHNVYDDFIYSAPDRAAVSKWVNKLIKENTKQ